MVSGIKSDNEEYLLSGANERPGTYDVRVEKEGYQVWVREAVQVRASDCGVRTVRLNARLEQEEGGR